MSIRLRLTFWYSTILAATLLIFGTAVYFTSSYVMLSDHRTKLKLLAEDIRSRMKVMSYTLGGSAVIYIPPVNEVQYAGFFIQVLDQDGTVVGSSHQFSIPLSFSKESMKVPNFSTVHYTVHDEEYSFLVYNTPIMIDANHFAGFLQVAVVINNVERTLTTLQYVLLVLALMTVLLAATLGWLLARKALKPIDNVIIAASQIEKGADLGLRIEYRGPKDEIGRLTDTINSMLGRIQLAYSELEESNRAQRRFVSDASHELRTPLTTIRGNVDLLEKMWRSPENGAALSEPEKMEISKEALQDISGEAARMSRLVNDLLSLARADAGYVMDKAPTPVKPILEEVARKAQLLPKAAEWQVGDFQSLEGVLVNGNKDYLQQLLFIFIENAFKYTRAGYVRMDAEQRGTEVLIKIADTGIGMDKEDVPHIFERFYRADPSRGKTSGTGLGLSIAKWIIDEHGGSIEVTTRKDAGTAFIIRLPVSFLQIEE